MERAFLGFRDGEGPEQPVTMEQWVEEALAKNKDDPIVHRLMKLKTEWDLGEEERQAFVVRERMLRAKHMTGASRSKLPLAGCRPLPVIDTGGEVVERPASSGVRAMAPPPPPHNPDMTFADFVKLSM